MSGKDTASLPLVSIIIRSMDRPTLTDALDSVATQTYPHIEVVVVNAKGAMHRDLGELCGHFPLRMIQSGKPFGRSKAANAGLEAATGEYLIFLDDDDLFYPEHIANLVPALQNQQNIRCAYAGVHVEYYVGEELKTTADFNEPFDQRRLWGRNFIPIHAMLFAHSLVTAGCRFDENLEFFEDWDFWIQLTQHTSILHVNKIGAVYRNYGHSGLGLNQDKDNLRELRGKLYAKWKTTLTGEQFDDLIEYREETIARLNEQFIRSSHANAVREEALHQTINDLANSTSWKITAPLRFISKIFRGQHQEALAGVRRRLEPRLKAIYWWLPASLRNHMLTTIYRVAGPFFSGMAHYEAWRVNNRYSGYQISTPSNGSLAKMVDIEDFTPLKTKSPGRIAIHVHIFYPDLAAEIAKHFRHMPFAYDLYISTPDDAAKKTCEQVFFNLPQMEQLTVAIVPNRGRDIAPMFCAFGKALQDYDFIAHLHSKKSLYNKGATDGWREYLLANLLGSKSQIRRIFTLLSGETNAGIVYPQNFSSLPYSAYTWLSNQAKGRIWCNKLGITNFPTGYFDFPAGSMFWAKTEALRPLFEAGITIADFPEESGQNDATFAHCLERLLVLTTKQSGLNAIILKDTHTNSWSPWRFDQYLLRRQEKIHATLGDSTIHMVIFDIFDTLLTRPLLNPERIKSIIAQQAGGETGEKYLQFRATAETHARQKAGRDVSHNHIFEALAMMSGLPSDAITRLRELEESVELAAVAPRTEAIALLQLATNLGKRVLLASDMYLPKSIVESMLRNHGITAWDQLYLSSDIGLRKDTGDLYRHIFAHEHIPPESTIVIGDNEHSDVQIPHDIGTRCLHILRPVELARAIPRLGPVIEESIQQNDLNIQLTLGMIARENFQPLFFPQFDPTDLVPVSPRAIGYTIAGPLVLAFVQWLEKTALADGIQRFYFLAREGQVLKEVYDRWTAHDTNAIPADYLVLSRRTVAVPMITSFEDILELARVQFTANNLTTFLQERYGLVLSHDDYDAFEKQNIWPRNKLVSVEKQKIDHLMPLLKALETRILAQAQLERPALMAYLDSLKLNTIVSSAIVDIGYAATIQGRLNRLMGQAIHGYYLITDERAEKVASQFNVTTQGCFGHYVNAFRNPPLIFEKSFSLEKMLSSNDAQIVRYQIDDTGEILPEFRDLTELERQTMATRQEIRRGMMDFVDQSIAVRDKLKNDFAVPPNIAKDLFETFIQHPSQAELDILSKLTLDDFYCGRGLVN
ncbi:MAG: glycosyltransferase [Nitrosomonas sp.]|nr:glycosyltransferase [Nitrosomonas sp.]